MVDTGIFATTAEIQYKSGAGASATSKAEAYTNSFVAQAESFINAACHFNFSDVYTTMNADVKGILKEAASNLAAVYVINYDYSGFPSRIHAEDMINTLYQRAKDCIELLKEHATTKYISTA